MPYAMNEKVFVPGQGIGVLKEYKTLDGSADGRKFMVIEIQATGVRCMIPENSDKAKRLRQPMEKPQAETVVQALKATAVTAIDNKTRWHRRHKQQVQILESGNTLDLANLVKSLLAEKSLRQLSFSEAKVLEDASLMIKSELELALGADVVRDPEVASALMAA